jgi:RNA polymerase sigma-70 factor (ECF subfamily)
MNRTAPRDDSPPDESARDYPAGAGMETGKAHIKREMACLLPELRAYARFLARDKPRADDLVQDTVVRALASMAQFQAGTSLKAWMFTILRNAFFEQTRRRRREDAALAAHARAAHGGIQHHHAEIADLSQLLWTLPPLLREALVLVGAQEMTHEEAAAICGVPAGTMRARVSRARRLLTDPGAGKTKTRSALS